MTAVGPSQTAAAIGVQVAGNARIGTFIQSIDGDTVAKLDEVLGLLRPKPSERPASNAVTGDNAEDHSVRFLPRMSPGSTYAGRFAIKAHLGRGGFADVYLTTDKLSAEAGDLAIKIFRLDGQTQSVAQAIKQELEISVRLKPLKIQGLVQVLDVAWLPLGYGAFIVQEYVPSLSLRDVLRQRVVLDELTALRIADKLCDTLCELHNCRIAHCDVKPNNILLTHDSWRPVLTDMGSASFFGPQAGDERATSFPYTAPEVANMQAIGPQADIYSLSVTLLHMLKGLPSSEMIGTNYEFNTTINTIDFWPNERIEAQAQRKAMTLRSIRNEHIRGVLQRALETSPSSRWPTIQDFQTQLWLNSDRGKDVGGDRLAVRPRTDNSLGITPLSPVPTRAHPPKSDAPAIFAALRWLLKHWSPWLRR